MSPELQITENPFKVSWTIAISAGIILLWVLPVIMLLLQTGTSGALPWGYLTYIALITTIVSPFAYGWYSRDSTGAIIIGTVPFLLVGGISRIISSPGQPNLVYVAGYFLALSIAAGLSGYFAAKKTTGNLLIALLLAGIWVGIFLSGIH